MITNPTCIRCKGVTQKAGHKNGQRRYRCISYSCGRTFFADQIKPVEKYKGQPAGKIVYPGYVYGATRLG